MADDGIKKQRRRYEEPTFRQHHGPEAVSSSDWGGPMVVPPERVWIEGFKPSAVEQLAQAVLDNRIVLQKQASPYGDVYRILVDERD